MRISDWSSDVCSSDLDLGHELVRRHARRGGQSGFFADGVADGLRGGSGGGQPAAVCTDIEIGLVQRQRLDQVGVAVEDLAYLARHRLVTAEVRRSEEHTSELQSLMRISYAVFCLKKKTINKRSDT